MGSHNKRKWHDRRSGSGGHQSSVSDALERTKRPRMSPSEVLARNDDAHNKNGTGVTDDQDWQMVTSKSARKKTQSSRGRREHQSDRHDERPRLSFQRKVLDSAPIQIKDLRDLALYVLADGVAPNWVAVKNARSIKKAVVLMLPGLDQEMLTKAKKLLKDGSDSRENKPLRNGDYTSERPAGEGDIDNPAATTTSADTSKVKTTATDDLAWLFEDTIPVKAPGDPKYSKVHSPLQAMLMKGVDDPVDKKHSHQQQEKAFQAVRTPAIHYVHSADELRDAEYPVHPALFTSQADGALEESRRKSAGQSSSDGWVDADVSASSLLIPAASNAAPRDELSQGLTIYAIDCEMVMTSNEKLSLARVSLVSWPDSEVVLDKYVKPDLEITNYFTQFSGITPQILENVTTTLADIQTELKPLFTPSTILMGHSLESDLNALKMTHPFIIDTSMLYPHPRGLPLRSSLKFLANKYLKQEIQVGGANGHNSVEDAKAVVDLIKLKCEKGPKWGTTEANGETVFKRLSRQKTADGKGRTSAIVEYGTPERGFGKDATVAIGCQNDDDVVRGVIEAACGVGEVENVPDGGVDFTWGRLRALEFARGWVTNNSVASVSDQNEAKADDEDEHDSTLLTLLRQVDEIRIAISRTEVPTLLILSSGTGDVRPVMRFQAMQNQYRKEFKVKKWNDLTVQWTDIEEQALRKAVEKARTGWGWANVV